MGEHAEASEMIRTTTPAPSDQRHHVGRFMDSGISGFSSLPSTAVLALRQLLRMLRMRGMLPSVGT